MILEYLSSETELETLIKNVKGLEVDVPDEDDYDSAFWPEMKSKRFISTYEKIKGHDGHWQLSFDKGMLFLIQFNIEFGSKSENAYNKCMDLCKSILKINNSVREMNDQLNSTMRKTYLEFKSEIMSDPGIPDGYFSEFAHYAWQSSGKSAYLSAGCTWPDSMSVEYREESLPG